MKKKIFIFKIKILSSFSHHLAVPNLYDYMIYSYGLILRNYVLTCHITKHQTSLELTLCHGLVIFGLGSLYMS